VKPGLEATDLSLVRPTGSKGLAKGESSFEDEAGWSIIDGPARRPPEGVGPTTAGERMTGDDRVLGRQLRQ
jgi:hypothetical protein